MSKAAISVNNLGKAYRIGLAESKHDSFKEVVTSFLKAPARQMRRLSEVWDDSPDVFWALRDASFEVNPGEVVGIIGRNGAGKSTLLKLLSRIVEPTEGHAVMRGRVSSLLEVGTGFHPELSGRENIYLNGAILGMGRAEIRKKFDAIVDFSEIGKFLDTPVKRYSSGMYVRLAFAVAAHLDPQIMIVDEVLAVGDAAFQKKCLGKMSDVVSQGRTILFVSHQMDAVAGLCNNAIVVKGGRVGPKIPVEEGIRQYMEGNTDGAENLPLSKKPRNQDRQRPPVFHDLVISVDNKPTHVLQSGDRVKFDVLLKDFADEAGSLTCGVAILNNRNQRVALFHSLYHSEMHFKGATELHLTCEVPSLPLAPGPYHVELVLADGHARIIERVERAASIEVVFKDLLGTGKVPNHSQSTMVLPATWTTA